MSSTRVVEGKTKKGCHFVEGRYPAACCEFVIPAEAGIQQGPPGLRVTHGMTGQNRRRYPAACRGEASLKSVCFYITKARTGERVSKPCVQCA